MNPMMMDVNRDREHAWHRRCNGEPRYEALPNDGVQRVAILPDHENPGTCEADCTEPATQWCEYEGRWLCYECWKIWYWENKQNE